MVLMRLAKIGAADKLHLVHIPHNLSSRLDQPRILHGAELNHLACDKRAFIELHLLNRVSHMETLHRPNSALFEVRLGEVGSAYQHHLGSLSCGSLCLGILPRREPPGGCQHELEYPHIWCGHHFLSGLLRTAWETQIFRPSSICSQGRIGYDLPLAWAHAPHSEVLSLSRSRSS